MELYESFKRIGTLPHRSYYIPFAENDDIKTIYGIVDRNSSSRFTLLDGVWNIKGYDSLNDEFNVNGLGCTMLTILFNSLCPIYTVCYWFVKTLKYLFTTGRVDV